MTTATVTTLLQVLEAALRAQTAKANDLAALARVAEEKGSVEEAEAAIAAMWCAEDDRKTLYLALREIEERHFLY